MSAAAGRVDGEEVGRVAMRGADADELDALASEVDAVARWLHRLDGSLAPAIHGSPWSGAAADAFRGDWSGTHRRTILASESFLAEAAAALRAQAQQQRDASAAGGGGGGGGGAGEPAAPSVPPRPDNPPADRGAGRWGEDPMWSRGDDYAVREAARRAADAAELLKGWDHAADNLRHYLSNSGDTIRTDPDLIADDVPAFRSHLDAQAIAGAERAAAEAISAGRYDEPIPFTTDWGGFYLTEDLSADWFYALGGVQTAATGYVIVHAGDPPTMEITFESHLYDRYNWDGGKSTDIGPFNVSDESLAELHRAGVAKEFDVEGTGGRRTIECEVGGTGASSGAGGAGGSDGRR